MRCDTDDGAIARVQLLVFAFERTFVYFPAIPSSRKPGEKGTRDMTKRIYECEEQDAYDVEGERGSD